jgi:hypothetical protein
MTGGCTPHVIAANRQAAKWGPASAPAGLVGVNPRGRARETAERHAAPNLHALSRF